MPRLILFNKPYGVVCQFSPSGGRPTLKDYIPLPDVYPAGRLDTDSEGLILLTDDGRLQHRIADPRHKLRKTYWVQVESVVSAEALAALARGVEIGGYLTRPARAEFAQEPPWLWPRQPPIRYRERIPTSWLTLILSEGKNRQVRRMTAAVGYPTLRLIRYRIGVWDLGGIAPGEWRHTDADAPADH